ncbi:ATP-dependent helicase [Vulgatibacter incomptus]|uniref:DNA 3'-5' helicase n=1 Tax=Vulgatibacter incomptus TaxID=1391653 RepID=A0A0K1P9N9_9BACT|nr:UvrD-helicase domain-containing protein [Vulgatibacter incomptus]AKU90212.1 ATP-dependent DNA helicase Rep [Vulgatibacter incomptus]
MIDLSTLNPPQREAVITTEGPLLVLAGAGSGKTRVIVHRIAWILQQGNPATSVLAMTFTNKAASEMRERVGQLVSSRKSKELTLGTFHAFGLHLLRQEHKRIGYPRQFTIADAGDQAALVKRAMREVKIDDRSFDPRRILGLLSLAKCEGIQPGEPIARPGRPTIHGEEYELVAEEVYPRYESALRAMAMVDFDDLIGLPIKLLREHQELRDRLNDRFRYLLVDEYQDTNRTQLELLKLLGLPRGNVCAVGDDDQAIYGWRGAEVENILRFHLHFPGAKEVRLEQNYRSFGNILDCANEVIAKNEARKVKALFTERGGGEKVRVVTCPNDEAEARFAVGELRASIAGGRRPGDHAILYRTNLQSRAFEEVLRAEGVPYEVVGGTEFFDRREVKDLLAYLRLFVNNGDEVSLLRIVNFPARGIGDATMEKVRHRATVEALPLLKAMRKAAAGAWPEVAPAAGRIQAFVEIVDRYSNRLVEGEPASRLARELCEEVDLRGAIASQMTSAAAASRRIGLIDETLVSLERFEAREGKKHSLAQYLAQLTLDRRDDEPALPGDRVVMMTLHAAKGLEFPVVFLAGLEEDLLPHKGIQGGPQDLPEERRLAYVGITRARERLFLTRSAARLSRGKEVPRTPSRFLSDLPGHAIEEIDIAQPTEASELRSETFFDELLARLESR